MNCSFQEDMLSEFFVDVLICLKVDVFTCTILCFLHHGEFHLIGEWTVHTKYCSAINAALQIA